MKYDRDTSRHFTLQQFCSFFMKMYCYKYKFCFIWISIRKYNGICISLHNNYSEKQYIILKAGLSNIFYIKGQKYTNFIKN